MPKLSDFTHLGLTIIRDGAFDFVGKLPTPLPNRIVFCAAEKFIPGLLEAEGIIGVLTTPELADKMPESFLCATAANPKEAMFRIHLELAKQGAFWDDFPSEIHPTAKIHPAAYVAEKNVRIGANTIIGPHTVVQERVLIGENCQIGENNVIGADAFEVVSIDGKRFRIPSVGAVELGNGVSICAGCHITRATFGGFTRLHDESALDNMIHIAHDCQLMPRATIAAGVVLSGLVTVGEGVFIGPNAVISNTVKLGKGAHITLGSVVTRDVPEGSRVSGNFAVEHSKLMGFVKKLAKGEA